MRELKLRSGRQRRRDDGAVLIIVAVFSLVAVLFMAFVVDIGNQRQNRRQLTTATDSPALAVAQDWVLAGANPTFDCDDTTIDEELAIANNPVGNTSSDFYECDFTQVNPFRGGVVTVAATEKVDYAFGGVTGVDESSTGSLTSVRVQTVVGGGLRPVAFCSGDFGNFTGWTAEAGGVRFPPSSAPTTVTLTNTRGRDADPCQATGNWNQVIFRQNNTCPGEPNASGGSQTFRDQYANGSPYDVSVNDCVSRLPGTGGFNSGDPEILEGMVVTFPVFDSTSGGGAGIYLVAGFLEAEITEVESQGNTTSFTIAPARYITSGTCCLVNEFNVDMVVCDTGTISGTANSNSSTNCQPRGSVGNPTPPVIPDQCTVTGYDPSNPEVEVNDQDRSVDRLLISVDVADHTDCGTMAMTARHGNQEIAADVPPTQSGDRYTFSFPASTTFDAPGTTYVLDVLEDTLLLDDAATLETIGEVVTPPPCNVTSISKTPSASSFGTTGKGNTAIDTTVTFTISVDPTSDCSGFTAALKRRNSIDINQLSVSGSGGTRTAVAQQGTGAYKRTGNQSNTWDLVLSATTGAIVYSPVVSIDVG